MQLAVCKACQNVYMVGEGRQFCPVCGGDPVILQEEEPQAPPPEDQAQEAPARPKKKPKAQPAEQPAPEEPPAGP